MALKLRSADLYDIIASGQLNASTTRGAYNALDGAVTLRVHDSLSEIIAKSNTPHAAISYQFVRAMQGPAMAMVRRGIAVNSKVRQDETERFSHIKEEAQRRLDLLADAIWGPAVVIDRIKHEEYYTPLGKRGQPLTPRRRIRVEESERLVPRGLNAGSTTQCLAFFNTALALPVEHELRKTPRGTERTPSANNKALRKWAERRTKGPGIDPRDRTIPPVKFAAPFISLILTIRDCDKMLGVLRTPLDADGRMRCSYNVVGTENGRWSSSKNAFGRGTNLQNITPSMRRMFCADDSYVFISTDLEQAEPRTVGGLVWQATGSRTYLNATQAADSHTTVASMSWPEFEWGDDPKHNRAIADMPCREYPLMTYREVSKRLSNGTNYFGTPFGLSAQVGVPHTLVDSFQGRYFEAFPAIRLWHRWVKEQLQNHQHIDTPLGRRRWFFGRPNEDSTLREAIACVPQSTVGELLNLIMYRVWARSILPWNDANHLPIQLLLQNHDAFAFQTSTKLHLPSIITAVNSEFLRATIPLIRGDEHESLSIPGEFVTGFNWAYADKTSDQAHRTFSDGNPDGLRKWAGSDTRIRQQAAAPRPADWLSSSLRSRW